MAGASTPWGREGTVSASRPGVVAAMASVRETARADDAREWWEGSMAAPVRSMRRGAERERLRAWRGGSGGGGSDIARGGAARARVWGGVEHLRQSSVSASRALFSGRAGRAKEATGMCY